MECVWIDLIVSSSSPEIVSRVRFVAHKGRLSARAYFTTAPGDVVQYAFAKHYDLDLRLVLLGQVRFFSEGHSVLVESLFEPSGQ